MTPIKCFHCGEAVLCGDQFTTQIEGVTQLMCCPGCQAVSQTIIDAGLTNYYTYRTEMGNKQTALVPDELAHFSAFDIPEVQQDFVHKTASLSEVSLSVDGITCAACAWLIEHKINKLEGVFKIQVNSTTQRAFISWNNEQVQLSEILNAISSIGYQASPFQVDEQEIKSKKDSRKYLLRLGLAGFATMQVMMFAFALYAGFFNGLEVEYRDYFRWVSMLFAAPVVFYSAQPFYFSAVRALLMGRLNMDVSVSIAICGAFIASCFETFRGTGEVYFESVSMFTFFLLLGRYFEQNARQKASVSSSNLHKLVPLTAHLKSNDHFTDIPAKQLKLDDIILVKPGEVVAADGIIVEGASAINESMLTGEQLPLNKQVDAQVFAGTINIDHPIHVRVTATGQDQLVAEIIRLQEVASNSKPKIALYADKFSNYFTAAILLIAAFTYIVWHFVSPEDAFWITLSVLVASCPCALALATPTAVTCGTSLLTRLGIIARQAGVFEKLPLIKHVVFDKTGTLTLGSFSVTQVELLGEMEKAEVLKVIAALESSSQHPIANAFAPYLDPKVVVKHSENIVGQGLTGSINGQSFSVGNHAFIFNALQTSEKQKTDSSAHTGTEIWLSRNCVPQAKILLNDEIRTDAKEAVSRLRQLKCDISIASGDSSRHVQHVGQSIAITDIHSGLKPQDKLALINQLQQVKPVAMFGDGINDAPVLAGANLSVAMGSGAAVTKNSADLILLGDHLSRFADAIKVAKLTQHIIKQNLIWALAYNFFIIPLAVFGQVPPYIAALGMSASSLIVVTNSLRLLRVRL